MGGKFAESVRRVKKETKAHRLAEREKVLAPAKAAFSLETATRRI
jgi:hypothetical protein